MNDEPDSSQIRFGAKIGRFVVDGELGSGGMGVVYAAHDRELDRHVALKVLRGAIDEESRMRLMREGQAMARVTHPNVITVYEVGLEGRMVFLAQELLDGGSLRQWLEKPRSQRDIVDKFVAAGRGLAAAHQVGLVHRDFKPDNVLLGKDGRVRVSDFGLARSLSALETLPAVTHVDALARTTGDIARSPMATMTRTGAVMGTPLYMSPEQHRGENADERSDQFSFCVALYEALYGAVPFPGKTAVALADNVIGGRIQPPPRGAKVSARLRRSLLRGLATDPKARYPSMNALIADLLHDPARKLRRIGIVTLITVLLVAAVGGTYWLSSRRTGSDSIPPQRTIALLGFINRSGDRSNDYLSQAISDLLSVELAQGDDVRIVPAEAAARARTELALPNAETSFSEPTLKRISDRLDANAVITGSYLVTGDAVTLIVSIADIHRGKTARIELHGQRNDLVALAKDAGAKIRDELHISSYKLAKGAYDALPKDPEAQRAFIEGTTALREFDYVRARDRLLDAVKREPSFAPSYIALAVAHEGLFDGDAAHKAARKALELAKTLGIDQQLLVSAQAYEHLAERDKAREIYRRLFTMTPKLEYGIALLRVESPDDFHRTVESVRRLGKDPRIDVLEGHDELDKGNAPHALELAQRAAKSGDSIGQADARRLEGEAQLALGNLGEAAKAYETSRTIYDTAKDRLHGLDMAELIAAVSLESGDLDDAYTKYDAVASLRQQAGATEQAAIASAAAAYALALRGKINDAEKRLKQADINKGQDPLAIPWVDLATAAIKWARGDAQAALKASENCAARFAAAHELAVLCLEIHGQVQADLGDFAAARKTYDEAQKNAKTQQRTDSVAVLLAQLDLDEGGATISDEKLKPIIENMKTVKAAAATHGAWSLEAHAAIVMAQAHLQLAGTQAVLEDVQLRSEPQSIRLHVRALVLEGLAAHHLGDDDTATQRIEAARKEADKQTCIGLALEARLGRAEMSASPDERKAELEAIVRDAKARGFVLIVKRAEALAQPPPP